MCIYLNKYIQNFIKILIYNIIKILNFFFKLYLITFQPIILIKIIRFSKILISLDNFLLIFFYN